MKAEGVLRLTGLPEMVAQVKDAIADVSSVPLRFQQRNRARSSAEHKLRRCLKSDADVCSVLVGDSWTWVRRA